MIAARRIRARRGGEQVPTHSVILIFDRTELPREVKVGYEVGKVRPYIPAAMWWFRYEVGKVRPYIPAAMWWFRCLRFGHTLNSCQTDRHAGNVQPRTTRVMIVLQKHSDA